MELPILQFQPLNERVMSSKKRRSIPSTIPLSATKKIYIGRSPLVDVTFDSPLRPKLLSRRHAVVRPEPTGSALAQNSIRWEIEDLGSLNGIVLNDKCVQKGELNHGDVIVLGGAGGIEKGFSVTSPNSHMRFVFLFPSLPPPSPPRRIIKRARVKAKVTRIPPSKRRVKREAEGGEGEEIPVPRKRGRPKGSKNKKTKGRKPKRRKLVKRRGAIVYDISEDSAASWDGEKEVVIRRKKRKVMAELDGELDMDLKLLKVDGGESEEEEEEEDSSPPISMEEGYEPPISSSEESLVETSVSRPGDGKFRRSRRQRQRGGGIGTKKKRRGKKSKPKKTAEEIGRTLCLQEMQSKPKIPGGIVRGSLTLTDHSLKFEAEAGVIEVELKMIQHCIFHPNRGTSTSLLQFFLEKPIEMDRGKVRKTQFTQFVQFFRESGRKNNERRIIDRHFREFAYSLYDVREKFSFSMDLKPKRHLRFEGAPLKEMLNLQPTHHCFVTRTVHQPFFLVMLDVVAVVYFERAKVAPSFDMVFVLQVGGDVEVQSLYQIPVKYLAMLTQFVERRGIQHYSGPSNLDWAEICEEVESDPAGFEHEGGWEFLKWVGKEENYDFSEEEDVGVGGEDLNEEEKEEKRSRRKSTRRRAKSYELRTSQNLAKSGELPPESSDREKAKKDGEYVGGGEGGEGGEAEGRGGAEDSDDDGDFEGGADSLDDGYRDEDEDSESHLDAVEVDEFSEEESEEEKGETWKDLEKKKEEEEKEKKKRRKRKGGALDFESDSDDDSFEAGGDMEEEESEEASLNSLDYL